MIQTFGFVRMYRSGNGGGTASYVYSQQVQCIMTLYAQSTVYMVGTVSAMFMTTWQIPNQKCISLSPKINGTAGWYYNKWPVFLSDDEYRVMEAYSNGEDIDKYVLRNRFKQ